MPRGFRGVLIYLTRLLCFSLLLYGINSELLSGRIKGDDEPHLVTWRVLEGVTEPFGNIHNLYEKPAWKVMKEAADQKAASLMIQLALHEYGQLLRHPYMFGEMPMEERYDVFLSMAKLLKLMGFHQRAELLLYEAMAYTNQPYEANLQLGLLFLDKEDTERAKMHFKNCLFFREADVLVLVHISAILIAESKVHEAKFFMSRLLTILEKRVLTLSSIIQNSKQVDIDSLSTRVDHSLLSRWLDDLMIKIFHGEFRMTPSSLVENFKMFSNLYSWLDDGEMIGRFVFDMGQSLFEGGKPKIGIMMMRRGHETSDPISEGIVSTELVGIRLALDFPVVPLSILDIIASYINMTTYLSATASSYSVIDIENIMDIYWPLPLIWWSNIPVGPVINELLWRFDTSDNIFNIDDPWKEWLKYPLPIIYNSIVDKSTTFSFDLNSLLINTPSNKNKNDKKDNYNIERPVIEIGVYGGHMNNHPTGHMVLQRILNLGLASSLISPHVQHQGKSRFRFTLLALPLIPDATTKHIASSVAHIVNLPVDPNAAKSIIEKLSLDIILFPDWQPFPDQQAILFQAQRFAPIQICFFVRGSSCVSNTIDYYILPRELEKYYLNNLPAASINTTKKSNSNMYYRPPWLEMFSEQVVMIDWPILTSKVIQSISKSIVADELANAHRKNVAGVNPQNSEISNDDYDKTDSLKFSSLEIEGPIFFEGQPVAVIPIYPSYLHPLMDDAIVKLMHLVSSLQVVLVVSDSYLSHSKNVRHKLSWARQLVRRLWSRSDNLSQRIRLLPTTFNDGRLLKLFKQADMILDTFPIGLSFHFHAMALSVGTPIITLDTGIVAQTPKADLSEVKEYLNIKNNIKYNPIYQHIMRNNMDIPWNPSVSSLSGFYERVGLKNLLVANSTSNYAHIASIIAMDKEIAYDVRIKLLEIVDEKFGYDFNKKFIDDIQNSEFSYYNITKFGNQLSTCKYGSCLEDLAIFLDKVGTPLAINRLDRLNKSKPVGHSSSTGTNNNNNNNNNNRKNIQKSNDWSNNNVIGSIATE